MAETETVDLSSLANVKPVKTTMRTSRRGRAPGANPLMVHVKAAYESGDVLSLEVPAPAVKAAERAARRAAGREDWSISIQVLKAHPEKATSDDVVALNALDKLPADSDVWLSMKVTDKPEEDESATDAEDEPEPENESETDTNPFAGAPEDTETAPATRRGRRSGKVA